MRLRFIVLAALASVTAAGCGTSTPILTSDDGSRVPAALSMQGDSQAAILPNLILDGSFEKPVVPVGGYTLFNTGQTLGSWSVTGAVGNVAIVSGTFTQNGFMFDAKCGKQWLDLTGTSNSATGVKQTIHPALGKHDLSFAIGAVYDPNGIFGTTSIVNILINGKKIATKSFQAVSGDGTKQTWKSFSLSISVQKSLTTVAFINGDPSNVTNDALDCVVFH